MLPQMVRFYRPHLLRIIGVLDHLQHPPFPLVLLKNSFDRSRDNDA
jgi:hypothetical protein